MTSTTLPVVGFIGPGDQGLPMALAMAEAGYPLHAWARPAGFLDALARVDYTGHDNIGELAASSDIVRLCQHRRRRDGPADGRAARRAP